MCCCSWFSSILLKTFASVFIMDIGLKFSFLVICQVLVSRWCSSHKMVWEGFPLIGLFGIVSEGVVPAPLCMSGRIQLWTHLDLGFLWLVGYYLLPLLQPLLLVYSGFRLLPGLGLEGASVQECINFFQVYWFMCIKLFVVISEGSLYFCSICGDIPFIVFHCINLFLFSFLMNLDSWSVYFLDLFKKKAPGFTDFLKGFFCLISFSSSLILVISCLLVAFEFFWSCSPSSFKFHDRVSILDLSFFSCGHLLL